MSDPWQSPGSVVSAFKETWRLLPYDRGSSAEHFARSDALARLVEQPTVWWHSTDVPTLILGAGQRLQEVIEACQNMGVLVLKRQAGGTSVFASTGVLGLDIALPPEHRLVSTDVVEAYRWLGEIWLETMHSLGIRSHLVSIEEARAAPPVRPGVARLLAAACFGTISPYEILSGSRKLVGLAQVRRRTGTLFQSGVHHHFDADSLARVLGGKESGGAELADALRAAATGVDEVAPSGVTTDDVIPAFLQQLQRSQNVCLSPGDWTQQEVAHAERYSTSS